MQSTAVTPLNQRQEIVEHPDSLPPFVAIEPVIELAVAQTNVEGAFVYHFDPANTAAILVGFGSGGNKRLSGLTATNGPAVAHHKVRTTAIVLQHGAWADWRFAELPEFEANHFEGVVSVPLINGDGVVGMVNFCQTRRNSLTPRELSLLLGLNLPLAALLTMTTLQEQLKKTTQLLADRKVLERAKGRLQQAFGWSEEQAYMHIRRLSRQQRTPMREIAERLIQSGKQSLEVSA